ncbi:MAG: hypothetical protein LBD58_02060 [Treponema sp.]|nr:hypothetical protein [Treponema sp.]
MLSWVDFLGVVAQMRMAQTRYFKTRDKKDLAKARLLERAVDKIKAERAARDAV